MRFGCGREAATYGGEQGLCGSVVCNLACNCFLAFAVIVAVQVLEFVCFTERLERSHSFVLARAERALLSITAAAAAAGGQQGAAGAPAAVAAAVQALPLEQLDSINWRGMRFNDDLTTRLPWLPPIQGPRQLVVLSWWEQQQQQGTGQANDSSAAGACWWRQVAAAEADLPAAAALRDSMKAAAQQRWLLPHLLHAALEVCCPSSSSSSGSGSQLLHLLERLAAAQGYGSAAALDEAVRNAFGEGAQAGSSVQPLSQQLQLLDAALFTLAHSLQVCVCRSWVRALLGLVAIANAFAQVAPCNPF